MAKICLEDRILNFSLLVLNGKRRVRAFRAFIVLNVIYVVILGVIAFVESLKLLPLLGHYLSDSTIDLTALSILSIKIIFILTVISGHLCGLFGVIRKTQYLLLISSSIGFMAFVVYLCLFVYRLYEIPVIVLMFGGLIIQNQSSLSFFSLIIYFDIKFKNLKQISRLNSV